MCIADVVPTMTIKTYPNQKQWINGKPLHKVRTTAFSHSKVTRNMTEYKQ